MTGATLEPGFRVILALKPGAAPLRVYGGLVKAVDQQGVRITLGDWLIGRFCGNDLWTAWPNIETALVYTPDDEVDDFVENLARWQHHFREFASPEDRIEATEQLEAFLERQADLRAEAAYREEDREIRRLTRRVRDPLPPAPPTFVYFVQAGEGGPIKIGLARNIQKRMDSIQTSCHERLRLLGSQDGDRATESTLHRRFAAHRRKGEWFDPCAELLEYIQEVSAR